MRHQYVLGLGLAALLGAALIWPSAALSQGRGQGFPPLPLHPLSLPGDGASASP